MRFWTVVLGAMLVLNVSAAVPADFARNVRPILSDRCFSCRGPDEAKRMAAAVLPLHTLVIHQAHNGFVDQSGGLQNMAGPLAVHLLASHGPLLIREIVRWPVRINRLVRGRTASAPRIAQRLSLTTASNSESRSGKVCRAAWERSQRRESNGAVVLP
jgi:hypothetical protein